MNDPKLQERLEQLGRRLVEDVERWEQATRDKRHEALVSLTDTVGSKIVEAVERERQRRGAQRQSREERRARRREERREAERSRASSLSGIVQLAVAALFATYAALNPELWWLIFVTLGLALGGTTQLSLVAERRRLAAQARGGNVESGQAARDPAGAPRGAGGGRAREAPAAGPLAQGAERGAAPSQQHEVDRLCDQLLAELAGAPEAVRQFIQAPEATIASLRATARALDARRLQLMSEDPGERLQALQAQEASLRARRDAVDDDQTRRRLDDALASIESQRAAILQLRRAAERVDGEYTSLVVSLQELRTRVVVAKSAGTEVQLDGLRRSVSRLNGELEAIGEALTMVADEPARPWVAVDGGVEASEGEGGANGAGQVATQRSPKRRDTA